MRCVKRRRRRCSRKQNDSWPVNALSATENRKWWFAVRAAMSVKDACALAVQCIRKSSISWTPNAVLPVTRRIYRSFLKYETKRTFKKTTYFVEFLRNFTKYESIWNHKKPFKNTHNVFRLIIIHFIVWPSAVCTPSSEAAGTEVEGVRQADFHL